MTTLQLNADLQRHISLIANNRQMMEKVITFIDSLLHQHADQKVTSTEPLVKQQTMDFIKSLSVHGGRPVPDEEDGMDALVSEKYAL